jgi:hypothetical protein
VLTDLERKFLTQLNGLDVAENKEFQALVDAGPSDRARQRLEPVLASIGTGGSETLASNARSAYRSMLGFYNGKLAKLGVPGTDRLVAFANDFSRQTGLQELPEIEAKTIKKMGLAGVKGLNIVQVASAPKKGAQSGNAGGGRGGSSGGRGGGGGRAGPPSRGGRGGGEGRGRGRSNSNGGARRDMTTGNSAAESSNMVMPKRSLTPGATATHSPKKPKQEVTANGGADGAPSRPRRPRNRRPAGVKDSGPS